MIVHGSNESLSTCFIKKKNHFVLGGRIFLCLNVFSNECGADENDGYERDDARRA